jgi:5-methylcytosine-specific restriction endonuclease McrBC regulatory subunit McrC
MDYDCLRYPDFYSIDKQIVLDAKYKRYDLWNPNGENNHDVYQIITYLHCLNSKQGGFLFPIEDSISRIDKIGELNDYGGLLHKIGISIPNNAGNFSIFNDKMKTNEDYFIDLIKKLN